MFFKCFALSSLLFILLPHVHCSRMVFMSNDSNQFPTPSFHSVLWTWPLPYMFVLYACRINPLSTLPAFLSLPDVRFLAPMADQYKSYLYVHVIRSIRCFQVEPPRLVLLCIRCWEEMLILENFSGRMQKSTTNLQIFYFSRHSINHDLHCFMRTLLYFQGWRFQSLFK